MPLVIGELLRERYRIIRPIGQGGMGAVYLAEDDRLTGRQCAIKEVVSDPNASESALIQSQEQFYREASILARLDHPNLPKVSDYFSEAGTEILVMDYVPGDDLKTIMDKARANNKLLNVSEVLRWTVQILDALAYLHAQDMPVVHRDIKPSNIKLTPSGVIKLVDFGLAKLLSAEERTITVVQGRGSIYYTPLEQYGGDTGHTDVRTDIYAVSATLYHLLSGKPPAEAKIRFLNQAELAPLRTLNPKVTGRQERAIHWGLALHPDERPQSIEAFRKALLEGILPDKDGVMLFVPENHLEWIRKAVADPSQRMLAILAGILFLLAVFTTFYPFG
jgi:serine/threonine protein kinase